MPSIPRATYTYTDPVPFVKPSGVWLPYYDQHFCEAMVHINAEESTLGIAQTTWYRYYWSGGSPARESFTPHNPAQSTDLFNPHSDSTQFPPQFKRRLVRLRLWPETWLRAVLSNF